MQINQLCPPRKSDIQARQGTRICAPDVQMIPSDLVHTFGSSMRGTQHRLQHLSHEVQFLVSSCPVYVCKTQLDFWLKDTAVVSMNQDLYANEKIQSPVCRRQGCSIPGPRNICWFAKNSQIYRQKGFLPGIFISRKIHTSYFGKPNMPQDYTEPDLNKSKFLHQAHFKCS